MRGVRGKLAGARDPADISNSPGYNYKYMDSEIVGHSADGSAVFQDKLRGVIEITENVNGKSTNLKGWNKASLRTRLQATIAHEAVEVNAQLSGMGRAEAHRHAIMNAPNFPGLTKSAVKLLTQQMKMELGRGNF